MCGDWLTTIGTHFDLFIVVILSSTRWTERSRCQTGGTIFRVSFSIEEFLVLAYKFYIQIAFLLGCVVDDHEEVLGNDILDEVCVLDFLVGAQLVVEKLRSSHQLCCSRSRISRIH